MSDDNTKAGRDLGKHFSCFKERKYCSRLETIFNGGAPMNCRSKDMNLVKNPRKLDKCIPAIYYYFFFAYV